MLDTTITYQQKAYDFIKNQITTLQYKPGQVLTDSDVARELDISRTPVREAFHRLENEGLLVKESRRGWRVYSLSLNDIHQIFAIKEVVEGMLAREAAACEDKSLRQDLQTAVTVMREAADASEPDAWLEADIHLHDILFDMVENDRAERIVLNLNDQWHRVRIAYVAMQGRIEASTQEHEEFIASILAGDGALAEKQMRAHLHNVRNEVVRLLELVVLPFTNGEV